MKTWHIPQVNRFHVMSQLNDTISIEADLVWPHIKNRLSAPVRLDDFIDTVHLPTATLDFTGSPKVILGYRFPEGFGEFTASYRSIVSEGARNIEDFDFFGDSFLKSRLNVNVIDLDYGTSPYSFAPRWELSTRLGVRIGDIFFDSRLNDDFLRLWDAPVKTAGLRWGV